MIYNFTQHDATPGQIDAGVVELPPALAAQVRGLITFHELPGFDELTAAAAAVAGIAVEIGAREVMIGGAGFFMSHLESALRRAGVVYKHAFSRRESVDEVQPDGSVRKVAVFRHLGFVPA